LKEGNEEKWRTVSPKYGDQFILKYHQEKPFLTFIIHRRSEFKGEKFKENISKTFFKKKKEQVNYDKSQMASLITTL
jgi:hypothetical protein